jgi:acetophenone carboxylase
MLIPLSNHWKDSCGHGKYRGGVGTAQIWVAHHAPQVFPQVFFMSISDNSKLQTPQPLFGGYAPCTVPGISILNADIMERMEQGDRDFNLDLFSILSQKTINGDWQNEFFARSIRPFNNGDVISFGFATGGAGYGDPLDRDPEFVMQDLRDQLISDWSADNVYKVIYDQETRKIDQEGTSKARQAERQARIQQGKPYDEFEKEWLSQKIDESLLTFYGSWPDAEVVTPIMRP